MNVESIRIALHGLLVNKLRTLLTMLGILIGVGAVIVLVAVGNGSSKAVQSNINRLGTNTITVISRGGFARGGGPSRLGTASRRVVLTAADAKAIGDPTQAPAVKAVAPVVNASETGTYQGATYSPQQFVGTTSDYFQIRDYKVASGSLFTAADEANHVRVVVLGKTVVDNLFPAGTNPIGANVKFGGATFRVVGVLVPKGTNGSIDQDDIAIAPLSAVQDSLTGSTSGYAQIVAEATSGSTTDAAQAQIQAILASNHKLTGTAATTTFSILNQASLLATSSANTHVFTVLLGMVAAISLLVGGIGVMNIMLVTVTERTREIGIRKAIGARRSHILSQFLVESTLLTVLGGITGVVAGLGVSRLRIENVQPVVAPYSVFLAFGVAVAIGLFFGIYPANRAASLRPIEALRYE